MSDAASTYVSLDEWIAREAIPLSVDSPETFPATVDAMMPSLGDCVELLGFGEALHGGEDILVLRNRLFERLVTAYGFRAIAIESSFPKARFVNEYITGRQSGDYEAIQEAGFGHAFGRLAANRELVEWMRAYNADPSHSVPLRFYGFDIPTSATGNASPRPVLEFVLDYLTSIDGTTGSVHREQMKSLLGDDSDWENPAQYTDPTKSIGLSPAATSLRIAIEDLITELRTRRPELIAASDAPQHREALQYAVIARQQMNYHAAVARNAGIAHLLGIRDVLMADNLVYIVERERDRGKVLVFAHNAHLQRGRMTVWPSWQRALGVESFGWWPAGAHLDSVMGSRYAVIGTAVGESESNGIGSPEPGTLEARLIASPGPARLIPTYRGHNLPAAEIATLPTRSDSAKNLSYTPLAAQSVTDFDWLAVLNTTAYQCETSA